MVGEKVCSRTTEVEVSVESPRSMSGELKSGWEFEVLFKGQ